mgnify:CR=1 FL=1
MYQIAVGDDEKHFAYELAKRLKRYFARRSLDVQIHLFYSAENLLNDGATSCNIIFLDVRLGEVSGMEVAKKLREKNKNVILIFVSAFIEYAVMGYSVRAAAYLLKSDLNGTFENCMNEVLSQMEYNDISIPVLYERTTVQLSCRHIVYVESYKRQIQIHTSSERYPMIRYYAKLSDLQQKLESHGFLRIHKSYLIHMSHCRKIQNRIAYMDNGAELACSKQNYRQIIQTFLSWKEREMLWDI